MSELSAYELAECIKANLRNLTRSAPALASNPFFLFVEDQVNDLCKMLESDD